MSHCFLLSGKLPFLQGIKPALLSSEVSLTEDIAGQILERVQTLKKALH